MYEFVNSFSNYVSVKQTKDFEAHAYHYGHSKHTVQQNICASFNEFGPPLFILMSSLR